MSRLVYIGKVKSTRDPDGLGRVQVEIPHFDSAVDLPWIRTVQPSASKDHGYVFLPEEGDEVIVLLGSGPSDPGGMFVLGSLYHGDHAPSYSNKDGDNHTKRIRTRSGNELTFSDEGGKESILLKTKGGEVSVRMEKNQAHIRIHGQKKVSISSDSLVEVSASEVDIKGSTVRIGT